MVKLFFISFEQAHLEKLIRIDIHAYLESYFISVLALF